MRDAVTPSGIAAGHPHSRAGAVMGGGSVLIWSGTAALLRLGGADMSVWQFLAESCLIGGVGQLCFYAARGRLGSCLKMPWRLWVLTLSVFVTYGIIMPIAIMGSIGPQVYGVNLLNYLWPVLTVVFTVALVPGARWTKRLVVATALAIAGLALANRPALSAWLGGAGLLLENPLPYMLGALAGVLWALYSAFIARWRIWASGYATAPIGFIIIGLVALCVCLADSQIRPASARGLLLAAANGIGPMGLGYLLWELALHRTSSVMLGLMAAAIPAASTLFLSAAQKQVPPWEVFPAAVIISLAALMCKTSGPNPTLQKTALPGL